MGQRTVGRAAPHTHRDVEPLMGWCHEFGVAVEATCDTPMHPGHRRCHCDECGASCPGRFRGCERVWERGALPEPQVVAVTLRRVRHRLAHLAGPVGDDHPDAVALERRLHELERTRANAVAGPSTNGHSNGRHGWARPSGGACPPGYPVKVKLGSGLFHLPGMAAYERTKPDRCYADAESAQADGFRRAAR